MKWGRKLIVGSLLAGALVGWQTVASAEEAADITYGYHPYWTGGWSGVIIKAKGLWKKHLPPGSTVRFEPQLTGPPMVAALLANKMQIGTMGDMPSLVATTKFKIADIRLVSVPMYSNGQICNKLLVRKDAPQFKDYKEAMKWMSGRPFAVHKGTCTNRFAESLIDQGVFKPSEVLSMPIEVIASNFEAGKLDAAAMWEPHARRQVDLGNARYVATGAPWNETDADFTLMREDFIEKHPQAAAGWIKAEIEAIQFMAKYPKETAQIIEKELTGYPAKTAWAALYERNPPEIGGDPVNYVGKMVFDQDVLNLMKKGYAFLYKLKVTDTPDMPAHPINDAPLKQALKEMSLTAPVAVIHGMPRTAFK
jgi:ABC-type nitrate/sulfonate/bicarbonate transport system substrate-binding protein